VGDVQLAIYRPADPNGQFWNGSQWQTSYTTVAAVLANAGGTSSSYSYSFEPPQSGGNFYVAAIALDTSYRYSLTSFTLFTLPDTLAPTAVLTSPVAGATSGPIAIFGSATDNAAVNRVSIAVYRESTGQFWNGAAWQSSFTTFRNADLTAPGAAVTSFAASYTPTVTGRLYIGALAIDGSYNYTLTNWTIVTAS
jgi:hypothetical protein